MATKIPTKEGNEIMAVSKFTIDIESKQAAQATQNLQRKIGSLQATLKHLDVGLRANSEALKELAAASKRVGDQAEKTEKKTKDLGLGIVKLDSAVNLAVRSFGALQRSWSSLKTPTSLSIGFERQFNMIKTLSADVTDDLRKDLLALAAEVPQTAGDITDAAYQAISSGIKPPDVAKFLKSASELAVAGGSTLTEAVVLLTTAVNSYEKYGLSAAEATDIFLATVQRGITTIPELTASFGNVASMAANYGISIHEVAGAIAAITKVQGGNTSEAITQLNALMKLLANPPEETAKVFREIGFEFGPAALRAKGLKLMLAELEEAAKANNIEIGTLSTRTEALQAIMKLSDGAMIDMTDSAGATAFALSQVAGDAQNLIDQFNALAEHLMRDLGDKALPEVKRALQEMLSLMQTGGEDVVNSLAIGVRDMAAAFADFVRDNKQDIIDTFESIGEGITTVGSFLIDYGPELLKWSAAFFAANKVYSFSEAITGKLVPAIATLGGSGSVGNVLLNSLKAIPGGAIAAAAIAAGTFIGMQMAGSLREAFEEEVEKAKEKALKEISEIDSKLTEDEKKTLDNVSKENLSKVFKEKGEKGLREFVEQEKAKLKEFSDQRAAASREVSKDLPGVSKEIDRLLERERTAGHVSPKVKTVHDFLALSKEEQLDAGKELNAEVAKYVKIMEEVRKDDAENKKLLQASLDAPKIADDLIKGIEKPSSKSRGDPNELKKFEAQLLKIREDAYNRELNLISDTREKAIALQEQGFQQEREQLRELIDKKVATEEDYKRLLAVQLKERNQLRSQYLEEDVQQSLLLQRGLIDRRLQLMSEGSARELALLDERHRREIEDFKGTEEQKTELLRMQQQERAVMMAQGVANNLTQLAPSETMSGLDSQGFVGGEDFSALEARRDAEIQFAVDSASAQMEILRAKGESTEQIELELQERLLEITKEYNEKRGELFSESINQWSSLANQASSTVQAGAEAAFEVRNKGLNQAVDSAKLAVLNAKTAEEEKKAKEKLIKAEKELAKEKEKQQKIVAGIQAVTSFANAAFEVAKAAASYPDAFGIAAHSMAAAGYTAAGIKYSAIAGGSGGSPSSSMGISAMAGDTAKEVEKDQAEREERRREQSRIQTSGGAIINNINFNGIAIDQTQVSQGLNRASGLIYENNSRGAYKTSNNSRR